MEIFLVSALAFAVSQLVLSALLLFSSEAWSIQRRLYALLLVAVVAYLLVPVIKETVWHDWALSVATAVPGMFWLFSASLFDDHFRLQRWQVSLVAITVFMPIAGKLLGVAGISGWQWLFYILPQALEFVLLSLALLVVARYWHIDLVESRRRLRLWFCGLNGVYIFILIAFRELLFPGAEWLQSLQYLPVGFMLLATNVFLLEYKKGVLDPMTVPLLKEPKAAVVSVEKNAAQPEVDPELVARLQQLVETEAAYRQMGLTIGQLASRLELPEYRLRQVINAGLGYRNFNDFLNSYRIREAAERLADVQHKELPVLTIALDTGFRSLSSFNKAFKATYLMTPTAFRRERLGLEESVSKQ